MPKTLYDKIWDEHHVYERQEGTSLLYVDRHLIHEVTSPQAFEGLRLGKRKVRKPNLNLAVADHNVPTTDRSKGIDDKESKIQVDALRNNCKEFGIEFFDMNDKRNGIVHIVGPEQGFTQPGTIVVCGDSHAATHGAFGALAFGIGTSEVEHVLVTQTLIQKKSKNFRLIVNGKLSIGVTAKDVILKIIGTIGTAGGTGFVIEFAGDVIKNLSIEERMTVCNMTIEGGARAGLIEPDKKTFEYLKDKPMSPKHNNWNKAVEYWSKLKSDDNCKFNKEDVEKKVKKEHQLVTRGIEVGHIFYFGDKYSKPLKCSVDLQDSKKVNVKMGSYGIGISRLVGAIIEAKFNNNIMRWPESVTPFDVAIIPSLQKNDKSNYLKAEKIYNLLTKSKIEVLFDDTDEHLSAKFKKFDLIGVPYQIILGSKSTENKFEFKEVNGKTQTMSLEEIKNKLSNKRNLN